MAIFTARAIDLEAMLQFLDPVLHLPAAAMDSIYPLRPEQDVGNDLACIVSRVASGETYHLCLDHNPAGSGPGPWPHIGIPRIRLRSFCWGTFVFAVELRRADPGQITEAVVLRADEAELLGARGWIVGRAQIDRGSAGMMFDDDIGQAFGPRKQVFGGDGVLETRQRWLRSEILSIQGIAIKQQLVHRLLGQGIGIVTVRITGGNGVNALPQEIEVSMNDLAGLAGIANGLLQAFGQAGIFVYRLEQNGASVGTAVRRIKGNGNGSVKICPEKCRLRVRLSRQKPLLCSTTCLLSSSYTHEGAFCLITSRIISGELPWKSRPNNRSHRSIPRLEPEIQIATASASRQRPRNTERGAGVVFLWNSEPLES